MRKEHEEIINLFEKGLESKSAFIGFDGFVDEIVHLVDKRIDYKNYTKVKTIKEFGERISRAAGLSTNIEFVTEQIKIGGNCPIFANAIISYGQDVTVAGALGVPLHPVFAPITENAKVYSISNPGKSDAVEFDDGKIILGKTSIVNDSNYENLIKVAGVKNLTEDIEKSHLLCFANWTMLAFMNGIWEGIQRDIMPNISEGKYLFFDLADPEKRTKEDIQKCLEIMGDFRPKFKTILGLNLKEAKRIATVVGVDPEQDLEGLVCGIAKNTNVYGVVIHPVECACACVDGEYQYAEGLFCESPKLTTGAGDNFNAGFCFGLMQGFNLKQSIAMGTITSGFYVRNARSPKCEDIIPFLKSL